MENEIVMRVYRYKDKGPPTIEVRIGKSLWRKIVYIQDNRGESIPPRLALAFALEGLAEFIRHHDGVWDAGQR